MTFIIVGLLAVVQSLFGIGLLVFGTPTLLLLGYPFPETLAILLPASLAVSLAQLSGGPAIEPGFARRFATWCLAPLVACLALVLTLHLQMSLNLAIAIALGVFSALRATPALSETARQWVSRHQDFWLMLMGAVHGLSNLGGGLLTILAASRYQDRERIRHLIAFCYSCFAAIQLGVLAALSPQVFGWHQLAYATTSGLVFFGIGRHVFRWVSAPAFHHLLTIFMASYAILLGLRVIRIL